MKVMFCCKKDEQIVNSAKTNIYAKSVDKVRFFGYTVHGPPKTGSSFVFFI